MGKHSITLSSSGQPTGAGTVVSGTRTVASRRVSPAGVSFEAPRIVSKPRKRSGLFAPLTASAATAALVLVLVVDPYSGTYANAAPPAEWVVATDTQSVVVADGVAASTGRDSYEITEPPPPPPPPVVVAATPVAVKSSGGGGSAAAPAAGTPDPGSAKAIAQAMLNERGMDSSQYNCLVSLWNKESGWNMYAQNKSSGAYGIPQALPGNKMASAGADWASNASTQISWGLGYIAGRYQTPCGAWTHSQAKGWY
ncbi:MAG TPA: lytic transglycosylase domain-containing protein [Glaciihabitans sp.]|nr:lytic transglycosylase domain-containing protein [Glaciihabitans sp.]